ncbi:MAG: Gx transporter family protein [Clostridiales bacterium]|nr:Gx transporter family protein [Clostridiales bacterium]
MKHTNIKNTKYMVYLAMCLALELALSYVEALFPFNMGIPGAKVGLPNIVTVLLLYTAGPVAALSVGTARVLLGGFMFGNLFAILYSAGGLAVSFAAMLMLKKTGAFGIAGVSIAGGICHNIGQILIAVCITNYSVLSYLPFLIAAGTAAGAVIGVISGITAKRLGTMLRKL